MGRMLIVDDANSVHDTLKALLSALGHEIVSCSNAQEAQDVYRAGGIDVVLADVWMRPVNGITLLKRLRALDPRAVVIMMTGFDSKEYVLQAYKNGAFDFLEKPFRIEELRDTLSRAFAARTSGGGRLPGLDVPLPGNAPVSTADAKREESIAKWEKALHETEMGLKKLQTELQQKQRQLVERESALAHREAQVAERESSGPAAVGSAVAADSELAQLFEELEKREAVLRAAEEELERQRAEQVTRPSGPASAAPANVVVNVTDDSLRRRHEELEARENSLRNSEADLGERLKFIEQSENVLFEKGQRLQEQETTLDQKFDDLRKREEALLVQESQSSTAGLLAAATAVSNQELDKLKKELKEKEAALKKIEEELNTRDRAIRRAEALIKAREQFLKQSESILFDPNSST